MSRVLTRLNLQALAVLLFLLGIVLNSFALWLLGGVLSVVATVMVMGELINSRKSRRRATVACPSCGDAISTSRGSGPFLQHMMDRHGMVPRGIGITWLFEPVQSPTPTPATKQWTEDDL